MGSNLAQTVHVTGESAGFLERSGPTMAPGFSREEQARSTFLRTSRLIESALLTDYCVPRAEALRLKEELFIWFDRFSRRPGVFNSSKALRFHLFSMTSKMGHVYCSSHLDDSLTSERARRALALGPEIIAFELEERVALAEDSDEAL